MKTVTNYKRISNRPGGFVLAFVLITMLVLTLVGFSVIQMTEGAAVQAVLYQNEAIAMSAAEAAYENAIYWMSDNPDLLLDMDISGTDGTLEFPNSRADYQVRFDGFVGYRPVFEVTANGYCGSFHRSIRVYAAQAISGWEMGMCRIPKNTAATEAVYFVDGEIIDMPIHINSYGAVDDSQRDIFIDGNPVFTEEVTMEESRHSSGGMDKYSMIMGVFNNGILFDQPKSLITDEASIDKKVQWFETTIRDQQPTMVFTPQKNNSVTEAQEAVQLEFFTGADGLGYVRITDDCTVRGYTESGTTWDYKVQPGTNATRFDKYPIYAYHYIPENAEGNGKRITRTIDSIQMSAEYGVIQSPPCGMIYVEGNVVIGCASENATNPFVSEINVIQGKVSVIATGNIWIASSIMVSNKDDAGIVYPRQADGMPSLENPNALGLFSQGVIKIMDPGMVETLSGPSVISGIVYEPIAIKDSGYADNTYHRHLPNPMVVEAAITVGGGGWGAEHVEASMGFFGGSTGGRKDTGWWQDDLIVRGTLTEVVRGIVGMTGSDGYLKYYYFDERMLSGLIPGTIRLKGKFVTTPGGWTDFRVDMKPE